ncbi:MAG: heparinase II/III-family protein [candidate division KSB1 bacterium]|nr:heparinase II/III-family protein [candidate division KSB1 bacterium]MDZ7304451.1 heparinase II/III-family protein [candidate division KSB1 bacterium]MDZ7310944.1 heparinase II/III-family protein [candidate division KSB1 bacterium]
MNTSRRKFLNRMALAGAGLVLRPWHLVVATSPATSTSRGLLFDPGDLPRLRETITHPRFAAYWNSLKDADLEKDKKFLRDELNLFNHVKHLLEARVILERTSFVYLLTKDQRQLEVAKLAIERILEFKKWDYFLEGGAHTIGLQRAPETTIAMCCAREWLSEDLSTATITEMEKQIAEKGARPCYRTLYGMRHPDRVRGWGFDPESDYQFRFDLSRWPIILNSTNLKVIPIAGLGLAGCLLYEKHPQAPRWVDLALQSARAFAPMFGADGSYEEGISYWGYTALHLALFLEVLYRKLGIDERRLINFPGTVRYALQMSMPTAGKPNDAVNFGDASGMGDTSVSAWVASLHRDPIAQYVATAVGEIRSHYAIIWYDQTVTVQTPGSELHDVRFANDWVVARTGWEERSSVVALRSGTPANHEHADRNSVIFKAYGERLLHDPFKAAYSYTLPHWLLRQTEAHTAVLIDGKGHQYHDGREGTNASWAEAQIIAYHSTPQHLVVTSDATEAYKLVNPQVELVRRTLIFLKPEVLLLFDRVRLQSTPAKVQLRFQVYNEDGKGSARIEKNSFRIKRPLASLHGLIHSRMPVTLRVGNLNVPPDIGIHPFVEAEAKESRDHLLLSICTAQEVGKKHGKLQVTMKGAVWHLSGKHNQRTCAVAIKVNEDLPVVTIQ